jgi:mono/diheme cytochrome c family protein
MQIMRRWQAGVLVAVLGLGACTQRTGVLRDFEPVEPALAIPAPQPAETSQTDRAVVERGQYLVDLLGCAVCHTDGALMGAPDPSRRLAGSRIGIAYNDPLVQKKPGIRYPGNLTPDPKTGLGRWTDDQVARFIRSGVDPKGMPHLSVMPWPGFARLTDTDAQAIVAYLRSLPPIEFTVPEHVKPGTSAIAPYVHFGVYRSRPSP